MGGEEDLVATLEVAKVAAFLFVLVGDAFKAFLDYAFVDGDGSILGIEKVVFLDRKSKFMRSMRGTKIHLLDG